MPPVWPGVRDQNDRRLAEAVGQIGTVGHRRFAFLQSNRAWICIPGRTAYRGGTAVLVAAVQRSGKHGSAGQGHRVRVPVPDGRVQHRLLAFAVRSQLDLSRSLYRRHIEHAARGCRRHYSRDHPRLHHRHRAAVFKLPDPQTCDRLCRSDAQHAAAAAAVFLVFCSVARDAR